ncbi:MAG: hypothetical protein IMF17_05000, partial [Proteobacteria bacterium]|nr:hypothetical protein [Pseudomonadota bacterium]
MLIKRILLLLLIVVLSACSTGSKLNLKVFFKDKKPDKVCESYRLLNDEQAEIKINKDIYDLQHSIEQSLVFRSKAAEALKNANQSIDQDKPVSPAGMDRLNRTIQYHIELMQPVIESIAKHSCWLEDDDYSVSVKVRLKGRMIVLATLMSLYDDYGTVFAVMNENEKLRRYLNQADSGYDREAYLLEGITEKFISEDLITLVSKIVKSYHEHESQIYELSLTDENLSYLIQVVEKSIAYPAILKMDVIDVEYHRSDVRQRVASDTFNELGRSAVNAMSEGFSNIIGDYEDRKGLLYADKELEVSISKQLQIGDI